MNKRNILFLLLLWLMIAVASAQTYRLFTTENGLTSSLVNYIFEDKYGLIWIATEDGLNKYDGVKITSYKHKEGDESSLASNYVSTIIEDAKGNLIVSTYKGLQIYRHDTDDFSPVGATPDGQLMKVNINRLMLEKDGRLYGTGDVSCEIRTKGKDKIEVLRMAKPYFSSQTTNELIEKRDIRTTLRYDSSHLLLGTDGDGVKLYDEIKHTYIDYPLDIPNIPQQLQKVHHLMRDRSGNLWIALYQKGIVMMSRHKGMFGYIGSRISQKNLIGSHCVQSIVKSRNGGMWVGTDGDGLYYLEGNKSQHISEGVPPMINALMEDSEGALWIGSYGYPCYRRVNGVSGKVQGLPDFPRVFCIREDSQQRVWLGTMGNGLYCYDLNKHSITHIDYKGMNRFVNCICLLSNGDVLVGTFNGIYNIDKHQNLCPKKIVYTIYEDTRGRLWIGTSEGLTIINKNKQKTYTTSDGMGANTVFAISEDEEGKIWFSTNTGLSCFDEHEGVFTNYSARDGLQGNEFSKGAVVRDEDGTLWFAGNEGITYFSSRNVSQINFSLHPRITALYINNEAVNTKTFTGGKNVIDSSILDSRNFSIAYENNSFSIELSTVEIDRPAGCTYCYSLDNGGWISIPDGGHIISFSNLDTGCHSLRYAVEYNGKLSEVKEANIEIRHPWWGSIWTKSVLCLIVVAIATLIYFWIRSREKVKALALISHKIRTPMSLIISPLIQLIDNDSDEQRQKTYNLMLRNAQRLQHLAAQATDEEPIGPIDSIEAKSDTATGLQQSRTTRHLVIVEDDDEVRKYLGEQLSADYHVHEATNGKQALQLIFEKKPDAIISDVTMPQMDGITLCRKLKKNIQLAHIPVILLTARADEEATLQGLGIGADAYITKPFNIKILRQTIVNLIQLRQQLRNTYQGKQLQEDKLESIEVTDYDDQFMERLMNVINRHISDTDFSVDMLCDEVGISRASLHRKLKEKTNQSTSIFIRNIRLKQAETLLIETNLHISEIASQVGFKQASYFINSFRELYGMSPNEWREQKQTHL